MSSVAYGNEIQIFLKSSIVILMLREFFTITANNSITVIREAIKIIKELKAANKYSNLEH